jgi:hypothetical protein
MGNGGKVESELVAGGLVATSLRGDERDNIIGDRNKI